MPKNPKIDRQKLIDAIADGNTFADSAKLAGSEAKARSSLAGTASKILKQEPKVKESLLEALEKKRDLFIKSLSKDKVNKANAYQLTIMTATIIDKIQLIKGLPTSRIAGDINFSKMSAEEVKNWLRHTLSNKG